MFDAEFPAEQSTAEINEELLVSSPKGTPGRPIPPWKCAVELPDRPTRPWRSSIDERRPIPDLPELSHSLEFISEISNESVSSPFAKCCALDGYIRAFLPPVTSNDNHGDACYKCPNNESNPQVTATNVETAERDGELDSVSPRS